MTYDRYRVRVSNRDGTPRTGTAHLVRFPTETNPVIYTRAEAEARAVELNRVSSGNARYYYSAEPAPPPSPPRVGVTFSTNGNAEGLEFTTIEEAAEAIRSWVLGIKPSLEVRWDWRIDIEAIDPS